MRKTLEQQFFETLDEKQKRLYAGLRANERGYFEVRQVSEELGTNSSRYSFSTIIKIDRQSNQNQNDSNN